MDRLSNGINSHVYCPCHQLNRHSLLPIDYFPFSLLTSIYINDNGWNAHYLGWSRSSSNSYRGLVGGTKGEEPSVRQVSFLFRSHLPCFLSASSTDYYRQSIVPLPSIASSIWSPRATLISRLIRTSVALTLTCTYLMWAITYLAQLHPLIGESSTNSPFLFSSSSAFHPNRTQRMVERDRGVSYGIKLMIAPRRSGLRPVGSF
jgi:hypothetical protein